MIFFVFTEGRRMQPSEVVVIVLIWLFVIGMTTIVFKDHDQGSRIIAILLAVITFLAGIVGTVLILIGRVS